MSDQTREYFELQDRIAKQNRLKAIAAQIQNDTHLKIVLLALPVGERREVYELLSPFLKFKPLNYKRMMRSAPKRLAFA